MKLKSASSGQEWLEKKVGSTCIYRSMVAFKLSLRGAFLPFQKIYFQSVKLRLLIKAEPPRLFAANLLFCYQIMFYQPFY